MGLLIPTRQSLRGLSEMSRLRKAQQVIVGSQASMGSLTESVRVFDPQLLELLFQELLTQPPAKRTSGASGQIPLELVGG